MRDPAIVIQSRVIGALMLRDIKTRFGGNPANYAIAIFWPIAHIVLLLIVYSAAGRMAPYGSSSVQFFATGVIPYMVFNYPSRFSMMALVVNGPLLGFPIVTMFDVMLARILLETINATAVCIIVSLGLLALDVDIMPAEPEQAVAALAATLLLAAGIALFNALIAKKAVAYYIFYILFSMVLYMASGIIFLPEALPQWAVDILSYNPLLHCVAWFRSAYYPGYGATYLDKSYLVIWGIATFVCGLIVERYSRTWLLTS